MQDAVSVTAADELSSSVSEDTGFGSAPPLPSDTTELCCDSSLPDSQDPHDDLDPAPPPPPAIDSPPGSLCEVEEDEGGGGHTSLPMPMPMPIMPMAAPPIPAAASLPPPPPELLPANLGSLADSPAGSVCEDDVTLALKELDERCEEEEADFSGMSR